MITPLWIWLFLACVAVGYVFGMVLTADLVCRAVLHRSAFDVGDGNPGMANIGHELGKGWALVVLAGDCLKVVVAVLICWQVLDIVFPLSASLAGLGATLGHNYPVWHRFRGGKGVTTTCAAMILAWPAAGIVSCLLGLGVVVFGGYLCWGAVAITIAYEFFCIIQLMMVPAASLAAYVSAWAMFVCATGLLAIMVAAHTPAILAIKKGLTPRAALSQKVLKRRHS
ncbi:glycerol-3-phosphate acyltransferase [Atopobiaceae bacterium 24-176]